MLHDSARRYRRTRDIVLRDQIIDLLLEPVKSLARAPQHLIDDARAEAQLALVIALNRWPKVPSNGIDDIWLYVAYSVRRRVARFLKREAKHRRVGPLQDVAVETDNGVDDADEVAQVLRLFKGKDAQILSLLLRGKTYREIRDTIGRSTGWIAKRMKKAREAVNRHRGICSIYYGYTKLGPIGKSEPISIV